MPESADAAAQSSAESSAQSSAEASGGVRDHLANERTQLAWLRTGANVMVVGLAVARFGSRGKVSLSSLLAGGLLVVVGGAVIVYGTLRYRVVADQLRHGSAEAATRTFGPSLVAVLLVLAVVVSAVVMLTAG